MTLIAAQYVPDDTGKNPNGLVRGSGDGSDANDGRWHQGGDRAELVFPGVDGQGELLSPASAWNPDGFDIRYRLTPETWEPASHLAVSRATTYLTITPGGLSFAAAHNDGGSTSWPSHQVSNNTKSLATLDVRRVLDTTTSPATTVVFERTDTSGLLADGEGWVMLDSATSVAMEVGVRPTSGTHAVGRNDGSARYSGDVSAVYIDKLNGTVHDWDAERDGPDGGDWVLPVSSAGAGYKALYLPANQGNIELSGLGDYLQSNMEAPTFTAAAGDEAGVITFEGLVNAGVWGRILSFESDGNVGFAAYAAPSPATHISFRYGTSDDGVAQSISATETDLYDGGRHTLAYRIGEHEGVRKLSIRSDDSGWKHVSLAPLIALGVAPAMLPARIGTTAYGLANSHAMRFIDWVPYQGWTPSLDHLSAVVADQQINAGRMK